MVGRMLYVSNLPSSATEPEVAARFAACGTVVSVTLVLDAATGRSKGFGFVEMASSAEALQAISRLNLGSYDGRLMSVNLAQSHHGLPIST